jgi:hypothetical protein
MFRGGGARAVSQPSICLLPCKSQGVPLLIARCRLNAHWRRASCRQCRRGASLGCPPGPDRGSWSCDVSAILGRTGSSTSTNHRHQQPRPYRLTIMSCLPFASDTAVTALPDDILARLTVTTVSVGSSSMSASTMMPGSRLRSRADCTAGRERAGAGGRRAILLHRGIDQPTCLSRIRRTLSSGPLRCAKLIRCRGSDCARSNEDPRWLASPRSSDSLFPVKRHDDVPYPQGGRA